MRKLIIILACLLILYRFQKTILENKDTKNKYYNLFNKVKIPLLFLSLFLVLYTTEEINGVDTIVNQRIYTSNPKF